MANLVTRVMGGSASTVSSNGFGGIAVTIAGFIRAGIIRLFPAIESSPKLR